MVLLTLAERPPVVIDLCEMIGYAPIAVGAFLLARHLVRRVPARSARDHG